MITIKNSALVHNNACFSIFCLMSDKKFCFNVPAGELMRMTWIAAFLTTAATVSTGCW